MTRTAATKEAKPINKDALVSGITAFLSWEELTGRIRKGYVPTLNPRDRGSAKLARVLVESGLPAWNPCTGRNWT